MSEGFIGRVKDLESRASGNFSLLFLGENDFYLNEDQAKELKFNVDRACLVILTFRGEFSSSQAFKATVDKIEILGYKPIIDQNSINFQCYLEKGEHSVQLMEELKDRAQDALVFGYVSYFNEGSALSVKSNLLSGETFSLFDGIKRKVSVFKYQNGSIELIYETDGVKSAALVNTAEELSLALVSTDGALFIKTLSPTGTELLSESVMDGGVRSVSASSYEGSSAFFALKGGRVFLLKRGSGVNYEIFDTGLKNVDKINSCLSVEKTVAVVRADREALVCVLD